MVVFGATFFLFVCFFLGGRVLDFVAFFFVPPFVGLLIAVAGF